MIYKKLRVKIPELFPFGIYKGRLRNTLELPNLSEPNNVAAQDKALLAQLNQIEWVECEDVYKPIEKSIKEFTAERDIPSKFSQVYILEEARAEFIRHLEADVSVEHGGILFGQAYTDPECGIYVEITAAVAASATIGTGAHLEFTPDSWQGIMDYAKNDFLSSKNKNLDVDELLKNLIGQKDRVSGEVFRQGEKVYFCVSCQLGYHEESWEYLERKCEQCPSSNVRMYTLPITSFREVKQTKPTEGSSRNENEFFRCGVEKINRRDYAAAILDFSEVLRINPKKANAYYNRGFAHNNLGNKQAAIDDYTQTIRINPHHADAYNNRGIAHRHLGAIQAAIEDYTQAIRINPHHADAYYNRGFAYHYNDDYTQALQINPNYTQAKKDLDVARSKLENTHIARASSNSNSRTSSSNEVYENYISALDI